MKMNKISSFCGIVYKLGWGPKPRLRRAFSTALCNQSQSGTGSGLSAQAIAIMKATAPVVSEHKAAITTRFYEVLMENHPEVKNLFNMSHQIKSEESGVSPQAMALANAVEAYAYNCDNLGVLTDAVDTITEKHVSLNVLPEHYPLVGQSLLKAIKDTLGDAATEEILEGWSEGYFFLADLFIQTEASKRKQKASKQNGGWYGFKELVVTDKIKESEKVTSFYFRQKDESEEMPDLFKAGQYLSFRLPRGTFVGIDHDVVRNYSISCGPGQSLFRISVKRKMSSLPNLPQGLVSNYFHDNVEIGSVVEVGMPCGTFTLDKVGEDKPIALICAGVGLTPIVSMLEHLSSEANFDSRRLVVVQCFKSTKDHPMKDRVTQLLESMEGSTGHVFYSDVKACDETNNKVAGLPINFHYNRLDAKTLINILPNPITDVDFFMCGPPVFQNFVIETLTKNGVSAEKLRSGSFGPPMQ